MHVTFGSWQAYAIDNILRHDKKGDLIHRIALVSTARQNGKSIIVRAFNGWMLDEGQYLAPFQGWTTLLAAAHDAKQARIIYKGVFDDFSRDPELKKSTRLTQYFGVEKGALTLDTVTAQPGSARGLSAGAISWDEVLTQRDWDMWEALSPTQSAQRSPIMLLTSTAGTSESVVLRAFYDRMLRQASGDEAPDPSFYAAWWQSTDPDAGLDWEQLRQANPALGDGRLTEAAIRTEHAVLPPDSWRRERLNHWVDITAPGAFHPGVWARVREFSEGRPLDGIDGPYALGVREHPGWERATICVAGIRGDGRIGVEVYRDLRGDAMDPVTSARVIRELEAFPDDVSVIAYDAQSGLAPELRRRGEETGLPYDELKPAAVVSACMDVTEMIQSARLACRDPLIDAQIATAGRRNVGQDGAFRFSVRESLGPIDAVLGMAFAAHAIAYKPPPLQIFM